MFYYMLILFWFCFLMSGERISSNWISFFRWISWAVCLTIFIDRRWRKKWQKILTNTYSIYKEISDSLSQIFGNLLPSSRPSRLQYIQTICSNKATAWDCGVIFQFALCFTLELTWGIAPTSPPLRHIQKVGTRVSHKLPLKGNPSHPCRK